MISINVIVGVCSFIQNHYPYTKVSSLNSLKNPWNFRDDMGEEYGSEILQNNQSQFILSGGSTMLHINAEKPACLGPLSTVTVQKNQ